MYDACTLSGTSSGHIAQGSFGSIALFGRTGWYCVHFSRCSSEELQTFIPMKEPR